MTTKRKKGSSYTPPAGERYWWKRNQDTGAPAKPRRGDQERTRPARDEASRPKRRSDAQRSDTQRSGASRAGANTRARTSGARRPETPAPELVTGRNPVVEALRAHVPGTALYVGQGETDPRIREAISLAADAGIRVLESGRGELERLTDGAVHQGIALQVPEYDYLHPDELLGRATNSDRPALIVAADGVTDPRNLGAAVRSAGAFGAHGLLVPERRAAGVSAGTWKASAGALARVPVARATNLTRTLGAYKKAGLFVVGLDAAGTTSLGDLELATDPLVLVVGSEDKGLSRLVTDVCDVVVRIDMSAATESLNAGVATGVALYDIARRRA